jgi:hypothetical protein
MSRIVTVILKRDLVLYRKSHKKLEANYVSSCLLFTTNLNSIGLSVTHSKDIRSPLRAQQVNAIHTFVTMVY